MRLNCSNKFRGRKVIREYFDVMTWFEVYTCSRLTFPLGSKKLPGRGSLMKTVLGGPGDRLPEKRSSTLKAARRAYQFENFGFALVGIAIGDGTREVAPWSSAAICNQKGVDIGVDIGGPMPMRQCRNPGRRIKSASE